MKTARLIYDNSEQNADLLYATRHFVVDAFLWWSWRGRSNAVFSPLEIDRARAHAKIDRIFAPTDFVPEKANDKSIAALILAVAKKEKFRAIEVPASFPLFLARELERRRLRVMTSPQMKSPEDSFFRERQKKSPLEIRYLANAVRLAEMGLARGVEILRQSKIGKKKELLLGKTPLTSERLRGEIDAAIILAGGMPAGTIVAGGKQGCDPHERGYGPLRAHEAIILDIFPRDQKTGYFGDLTRTFVRGRASLSLQELYAAVAEGKRWAISQMRAGADGKKIHEQVKNRFTLAGYPTEQRKGKWVGFFHGTGHGLGLALHEAPRFSSGKFFSGQSLTVEPGLYYPEIGGVRLEDVVIVKKGGSKNLTQAPQFLEI